MWPDSPPPLNLPLVNMTAVGHLDEWLKGAALIKAWDGPSRYELDGGIYIPAFRIVAHLHRYQTYWPIWRLKNFPANRWICCIAHNTIRISHLYTNIRKCDSNCVIAKTMLIGNADNDHAWWHLRETFPLFLSGSKLSQQQTGYPDVRICLPMQLRCYTNVPACWKGFVELCR